MKPDLKTLFESLSYDLQTILIRLFLLKIKIFSIKIYLLKKFKYFIEMFFFFTHLLIFFTLVSVFTRWRWWKSVQQIVWCDITMIAGVPPNVSSNNGAGLNSNIAMVMSQYQLKRISLHDYFSSTAYLQCVSLVFLLT